MATLCLLFLPLFLCAQSMEDYRWKNRVVLLLHKQPNAPQLVDQLEHFQEKKEELRERDMLLIIPKKESKQRMLEDLGIARDFQGVVLVGKDGGVKYKSDFPVTPQRLFDLVDSMPMRRAEIKRKKG